MTYIEKNYEYIHGKDEINKYIIKALYVSCSPLLKKHIYSSQEFHGYVDEKVVSWFLLLAVHCTLCRWYRAPELLVGDTQYGTPVDVWAIGKTGVVHSLSLCRWFEP